MNRLLLPLAALLPMGCARFAHGVVAERASVMASFRNVQTRVDQTYGLALGAPVAVGLAVAEFGVTVGMAGMSGIAHLPSDVTGAVGFAPCEYCAMERAAAQPTSRPLIQP